MQARMLGRTSGAQGMAGSGKGSVSSRCQLMRIVFMSAASAVKSVSGQTFAAVARSCASDDSQLFAADGFTTYWHDLSVALQVASLSIAHVFLSNAYK